MRDFIKIAGALLIGALLAGGGVWAAQVTPVMICDSSGNCAAVTTSALNVNATVTGATLTGTPITPVVSASAEASHVLKNSAGTLYNAYAVNLTSTPGYLVVVNATAAPSDGAITPLDCVPLPAYGSAAVNYNPLQGRTYSTGIVAVVTSASTCFTKTTGVITAFINGGVS